MNTKQKRVFNIEKQPSGHADKYAAMAMENRNKSEKGQRGHTLNVGKHLDRRGSTAKAQPSAQ